MSTTEAPTFEKLAHTAQAIRETRGSNAKIALAAGYFQLLEMDEDLDRAARFLGEGAFSSVSGKRASVGSRTYSTGAAAFCKIDYEAVFKPCKTTTGSASEAIEKLMQNMDAAGIGATPPASAWRRWKTSTKNFTGPHRAQPNNKYSAGRGSR